MKVSIQENTTKEIVFQQIVNDDSALMNKVVAFFMSAPAGNEFTCTISNKGHELPFKTNSVDVGVLVRLLNNIVVRTKEAK